LEGEPYIYPRSQKRQDQRKGKETTKWRVSIHDRKNGEETSLNVSCRAAPGRLSIEGEMIGSKDGRRGTISYTGKSIKGRGA